MANRRVGILFILFAVSGFTGLVYESIWAHYLKLFLGSAAFAQSFVLSMFMGGMAIGAWVASRRTAGMRNLLAAYGWIELLIGLAALVFHEAYAALVEISLSVVIPSLGSPVLVELFKHSICGLLILPQTVLLGMTFPLMSGAVLRRSPGHSGHHLALLYFTNSIGAAAGVLFASFVLLDWLGMAGTMRLAGVLNLALAAAVLLMSRQAEQVATLAPPGTGNPSPADSTNVRLFLAAAFLTGAASFIYEIAWIRMLSLVLGASFQAFELMLSAFITGLALGGLWMRRRIDGIADPVRAAGLIQVAMALAVLATIFVYHQSFDWMAWAMRVLQPNDSAYPLFNLFSHAIAFAVMLPATFFAGMTLPLFTHVLLREGHGERAIGQVYAANSVGAVLGALLAVHVLVPEVGVKLTLIVGAALDVFLGAYLLRRSISVFRRMHAITAALLGLLALSATARAQILEPARLSSGVFRYGRAINESERVVFYKDGKTASVAVKVAGSNVSIITNGKPDAAINLDMATAPNGDEHTMTLLGALPLLIKPDAKRIANIGFGSGLTAEVMLSHSVPAVLHTVEIEPAMVEGARAFRPRVSRPFSDPRSQIFYEDAKSYLARHGKTYDVIVSEPSNPWVNGVAGLFTTEFYREARRYLAPEGVFVQWLHMYEFNDMLMASILSALGENFADYEVFDANGFDLVVVAVAQGKVPPLRSLPSGEAAFLGQLARIGVTNIDELNVRRLGAKAMLEKYLATLDAPVNSDFRPFVQLHAVRQRYVRQSAQAIHEFHASALPILELLERKPTAYVQKPSDGTPQPRRIQEQSAAYAFARVMLRDAQDAELESRLDMLATAVRLRQQGVFCGKQVAPYALQHLQRAAAWTLAALPTQIRNDLWVERTWIECPKDKVHPVVQARLELYAAISARDAPRMHSLASAMLPEASKEGATPWAQFVLSSAVLGAKAAGDKELANALWKAHVGPIYGSAGPPLLATFIGSF